MLLLLHRSLLVIAAILLLLLHEATACELSVTCSMNGRPCNSPRALGQDGNCFAEMDVTVTFRNTGSSAVSPTTAQLAFPSFATENLLSASAWKAVAVGQTVTATKTFGPILVCGDTVPPFSVAATLATSTAGCLKRQATFDFSISPLCLPVKGACLDDDFCCSGLTCEFLQGCKLPATLAFGCFSGDTIVQTRDATSIAMRDVKIGDYIANADGAYDRVYSFGHYHPDIMADFVRFQFASSTQPSLEMTPSHLVFTSEGTAIPASQVRVGDALRLAGAGTANLKATAVVQRIDTVTKRGVYAPFTESGTISVNNLAASSFVTMQGEETFFTLSSGNNNWSYQTPLSWHAIAHAFEAPHRIACRFTKCVDTYNDVGLNTWVAGPYRASKWLEETNQMLFFVAVAMGLVLVVVLRILEELLLGNTNSSVAVKLFCLLVGGTWYCLKTHGRSRTGAGSKQL